MKEASDWTWWFLALGAATAMMCCAGCVNLQPCASYLDEHVKQSIEEVREIARHVPEDSPARPFVQELNWRLAERMTPWSSELRRHAGPVVVDVPVMGDQDSIRREDRALEEFTSQIDIAKELPWQQGGFPWEVAGGGTGMSLVVGIAGMVLKRMKAKAQYEHRMNRKLHYALNCVKTAHPESVKEATAHDKELRESYERHKAEELAEELEEARRRKA
jgi:hypothetical protein